MGEVIAPSFRRSVIDKAYKIYNRQNTFNFKLYTFNFKLLTSVKPIYDYDEVNR